MNILRSKLTHAAFCLIIILSFAALANGQTDACSQRVGGASGYPNGSWCDGIPGDVVGFQGTADEFVCRGCYSALSGHTQKMSKGGTAACTQFSKQMLIEFSNPVADLQWEILGARTATDNRGYTVRMNPPPLRTAVRCRQ